MNELMVQCKFMFQWLFTIALSLAPIVVTQMGHPIVTQMGEYFAGLEVRLVENHQSKLVRFYPSIGLSIIHPSSLYLWSSKTTP